MKKLSVIAMAMVFAICLAGKATAAGDAAPGPHTLQHLGFAVGSREEAPQVLAPLGARFRLEAARRGRIVAIVLLLVGYWALMTLVPVPGYGAGQLDPDGNLGAYLDRLLLTGDAFTRGPEPAAVWEQIQRTGAEIWRIKASRACAPSLTSAASTLLTIGKARSLNVVELSAGATLEMPLTEARRIVLERVRSALGASI